MRVPAPTAFRLIRRMKRERKESLGPPVELLQSNVDVVLFVWVVGGSGGALPDCNQ